MKVVFTGGGSGGHFYPIIAVAEEINTIIAERKLLDPKLFYIGPEPYDSRALYENNIEFKQSPAGKMRRYFSLLNVTDLLKTITGILGSIWQLYQIYPDVIFSKGGYASFPTLVAARLLRIPVIIHESDAVPGRVTKWSAQFAKKIAVSYPETATFFDEKKTALTGQPVRHSLYVVAKEGGKEFLDLDNTLPTLFIVGGSLGSQRINDTILDALPKLVNTYQIIHQTGEHNFEEVQRTASFILRENPHQNRYHVFDFLNPLALRMAAGAATLIISRAGSGLIFEIAMWGVPSIMIPIPEDISHDQTKNAFSYARSGAAIVVEEKNLTPNLLLSEINRLIGDTSLLNQMGAAAKKFSKPKAARSIAEAIITIGLSHEFK